MKKEALLIFLLLPALALAQDDFASAETLTIRHDVFSSFTVLPESDDYSLKNVIINLSFFPKETMQQQILEQTATPDAEKINDRLIFRFQNPKMTDYYKVSSLVKTSSRRSEVKSMINFPIDAIPGPAGFFLDPSELVDSDDPKIIALASQIVEGETDLFTAVTNLGMWVKSNIEYNISTATETASQKATWVLSNRKGVCDELTNLFIALNRALGIPARFVSGIAYTNSETSSEQWGPHGWAEVYFPGVGWVAFDVTYGQFGYVDATHIVSGMGKDASEMSTQLSWYGSNVKVDFEKLRFSTKVTDQGGKTRSVKIDAHPIKESVGFGSYNIIEAVVENLNDYYSAVTLGISKVNEIENIDAVEKNVILKPNERKSVFWMVKIPESLSRYYVYSFPLVIFTNEGATGNTSFRSRAGDETIIMERAVSMLNDLEKESAKYYSREIFIDCYTGLESYYVYENKTINCIVQNKGNMFLRNLSVCLENMCGVFDLGISRQKNVSFSVDTEETGSVRVDVIASGPDVFKKKTVQLEILDVPKIKIESMDYPKNISYGKDFRISFSAKKVSDSVPKNAKVEFVFEDSKKQWDLGDLSSDKRIAVEMNSRQLSKNPNLFRINVEYFDLNNKKYMERTEFEIKLNKLGFFQQINYFFGKIGKGFSKIFK